jgi:hypothetical protein
VICVYTPIIRVTSVTSVTCVTCVTCVTPGGRAPSLLQAWLVKPSVLEPYATLRGWFDTVKAEPRTQTVLRGESSMGKLEQYYQAVESKDVCRDGDERGRWG